MMSDDRSSKFFRRALTVLMASTMLAPGAFAQATGSAKPATPTIAPAPAANPKTAPTTAPSPQSPANAGKPPGKALTPSMAPPEVAPPIARPGTPTTANAAAPAASEQINLNEVAELEKLMFGEARPNIPIEYRLDRLESETFHATNPDWTVAKRIQRLTQTLIGSGLQAAPPDPNASLPYPPDSAAPARPSPYQTPYASASPYNQQTSDPYGGSGDDYQGQPAIPVQPQRKISMPPAPDLDNHEFQKVLPQIEVEKFALQQVNEIRQYNGLPALAWDDIAHKVAQQHISDLAQRNTVSHHSVHGHNPDLRYTKAGGSDAMIESLICLATSGRVPLNKALVYRVVQELTASADDRNALLSAYATKYAFALSCSNRNNKLIACSEMVTDQGEIEPIPTEVAVGDKITVQGTINEPLKFQKITLAYEGLTTPPEGEEEQDEALPYFPPLDYTAFARKSEHDWDKAARMLQLAGIGLAIAGGMVMPPVALAAPLIAMAGPTGKPKPVSDIPVKGGVKVSGKRFEHATTISKEDKEGIYYITVWAQTEQDPTPIAVSRRAIIAKAADPVPVSGDNSKAEQSDKSASKKISRAEKKKSKKDNQKNKKRELITAADKETGDDKAGVATDSSDKQSEHDEDK